jgi:hypothetical protein
MTIWNNLAVLSYIGPGGGIALLGPLLGVIGAVIGAVAMVAFWPIRMWIRRIRSSRTVAQDATE